MAVSFRGGVRLKEYGGGTLTGEAKPVSACRTLIFPLTGENGVKYIPEVKAGDEVRSGQRIAHSDDNWELPMHSSASGRVEQVSDSVTIVNNELYETIETSPVNEENEKELILALQNSGIADMHGGEFICGGTLLEMPPKYLIVDALHSEPYASALCTRAAQDPKTVVRGVRTVQRLLKARSVYICISSDAHEAIDGIRGAVRYDESITVLTMKYRYPQQHRSVLARTVTGRTFDEALKEGCVITNAEVMYQVGHTVETGMPMTERIVTVGGDALLEPDNFAVPIGAPVSVLISEAKGFTEPPERITMNGLMSGSETGEDGIVTKNTSSIQVMLPEKTKKRTGECMRCGRCVKSCPASLMPFKLSDASVNFKVSKSVAYGIYDCIGCGLCTYVCPAGLPLAKNIADMAESVRKIRRTEEGAGNE